MSQQLRHPKVFLPDLYNFHNGQIHPDLPQNIPYDNFPGLLHNHPHPSQVLSSKDDTYYIKFILLFLITTLSSGQYLSTNA